jgi:hypothetical protein
MPRLCSVLLTLLMLAMGGQAIAQSGGAHRRGADAPRGDRPREDAGGERPEATRMDPNDPRTQLARVSRALKLTPAQAALWQAYEDSVLELLSDLNRTATTPPGEDAVHQIDRKVDTVRNRLAALEDLSDAAKKLYASLSGEQKELADRMLPGTVPALYSGQPVSTRGEGRPPGERAR